MTKKLREIVENVIDFKRKQPTASKVPLSSVFRVPKKYPDPTITHHDFSWGHLVHVEVGPHFSIPIHPESQFVIKHLKDGQSKSLKIDGHSGDPWKATRRGDQIHFHTEEHGETLHHPIVLDRKHFDR